jgi:magnesium chelatase family protein
MPRTNPFRGDNLSARVTATRSPEWTSPNASGKNPLSRLPALPHPVSMTLAVVRSRALSGMFAPEVTVEVHLANGLPAFTMVGLPDTEVRESRERVRAALLNCKFEFPGRRITVNLAPADLPKESGRFDLPIALAILAASGQLTARTLDKFEFAGELSLTGELRPIRGTLAMTYAVSKAAGDKSPPRGFVIPAENADEAALVRGINIYPAKDLLQVVEHLEADGQAAVQEDRTAQRGRSPDAAGVS